MKAGDTVTVGDRLAVLEAMKMEMQVVAPFSGKVRQVMTMRNVQVDTGAPLLQIEPDAGPDAMPESEGIVFGASQGSGGSAATKPSCRQSLEGLRQLMLGFDVDPKETTQLLTEWSQTRPEGSNEINEAEDEILNIFVDICSLFKRNPEVNHRASGEEPSPEAYLFSYLRSAEDRWRRTSAGLCRRASPCFVTLWRSKSGSLAGTGREPALDLQISSTRRAADRPGYGYARASPAVGSAPCSAR